MPALPFRKLKVRQPRLNIIMLELMRLLQRFVEQKRLNRQFGDAIPIHRFKRGTNIWPKPTSLCPIDRTANNLGAKLALLKSNPIGPDNFA
jgi:hypothetical protein